MIARIWLPVSNIGSPSSCISWQPMLSGHPCLLSSWVLRAILRFGGIPLFVSASIWCFMEWHCSGNSRHLQFLFDLEVWSKLTKLCYANSGECTISDRFNLFYFVLIKFVFWIFLYWQFLYFNVWIWMHFYTIIKSSIFILTINYF